MFKRLIKNRRLCNLLLLLTSVVLTVGVCEVVLRWLDLPKLPNQPIVENKSGDKFLLFGELKFSSGDILYILKYNPSKRFKIVYSDNPRGYFNPDNSIEYFIDADGYRYDGSADYSSYKDKVKLAFLGDSFTFGQGVRYEDTYPMIICKSLNQKLKEKIGKTFECRNFGVGGANIFLEKTSFILDVTGYNPHILILAITLNDVEPVFFSPIDYGDIKFGDRVYRHYEADVFEGANSEDVYKSIRKGKSRILSLIKKIYFRNKLTKATISYYKSLYTPSNSWLQENLNAIIDISQKCRELKIDFIVAIVPMMIGLEAEYPFEKEHAFLRTFLLKNGITFIDLLPAFKGKNSEELRVHETDAHPNEIAHRIIGETLSKELEKMLVSSN